MIQFFFLFALICFWRCGCMDTLVGCRRKSHVDLCRGEFWFFVGFRGNVSPNGWFCFKLPLCIVWISWKTENLKNNHKTTRTVLRWNCSPSASHRIRTQAQDSCLYKIKEMRPLKYLGLGSALFSYTCLKTNWSNTSSYTASLRDFQQKHSENEFGFQCTTGPEENRITQAQSVNLSRLRFWGGHHCHHCHTLDFQKKALHKVWVSPWINPMGCLQLSLTSKQFRGRETTDEAFAFEHKRITEQLLSCN